MVKNDVTPRTMSVALKQELLYHLIIDTLACISSPVSVMPAKLFIIPYNTTFSSIISAVDPVAVLAMYQSQASIIF